MSRVQAAIAFICRVKYRLLGICQTCGGCGDIFVQQRSDGGTAVDYVRETCPGPNMGCDGIPCPHICENADSRHKCVGESIFAAVPDIIVDERHIHATLANGRRVSLPMPAMLSAASTERRQDFEVHAAGIHWPGIGDVMAEMFGGAPYAYFSGLDEMVESVAESISSDAVPQRVKDEFGRLLRYVCGCDCHCGYDCHRFDEFPDVLAHPCGSRPHGSGRGVGAPADPCVKCHQRRGSV